MKGKILLAFLAVSGLLINPQSAAATTSAQVSNLSRTITDIVNLDADNLSLIEKAIERALIVKEIQNNNDSEGTQDTPIIRHPRGRYPKPKDSNAPVKNDNDTPEHSAKKDSSTPNNTSELGVLEGGESRSKVTRRKYKIPAWIINNQKTSVIGVVR
jgi:hypothetical protein